MIIVEAAEIHAKQIKPVPMVLVYVIVAMLTAIMIKLMAVNVMDAVVMVYVSAHAAGKHHVQVVFVYAILIS